MKRNRLIGMLFVAALVAVFVGCTADRGVSAPSAADEITAPTDGSAGPQLGIKDKELKGRVDGIRARFDSVKKNNRAVRDSLRALWKEFKKNNPHVKKNNSPFPICEPKDYDFDVQVIGPEGGSLKVGGHRLVIPEGALAESTVITAERPSSFLIEVQFSPHGTTFLEQPRLELDYSDCYLPADHQYRVAYASDDGRVLEYPVSVDKGGNVLGFIWHFSRYAVAF